MVTTTRKRAANPWLGFLHQQKPTVCNIRFSVIYDSIDFFTILVTFEVLLSRVVTCSGTCLAVGSTPTFPVFPSSVLFAFCPRLR